MTLQYNTSMVSCQKGPTRHAYAWQIGPFLQDNLDITEAFIMEKYHGKHNKIHCVLPITYMVSFGVQPVWTRPFLRSAVSGLCRIYHVLLGSGGQAGGPFNIYNAFHKICKRLISFRLSSFITQFLWWLLGLISCLQDIRLLSCQLCKTELIRKAVYILFCNVMYFQSI